MNFCERSQGEQALEQFKYNGHYYTVLSGTVICGLLYNKDMFKAAGIVDENGEAKPPKTYAEMREYAKKLTNTKKRQYGFILPGKSTGTYWSFEVQWPMMASVGHDGFDINTGKYDYSGMAPILQTIMDMKNDGSCYPGIESIDADPARARFAEGNVGMKFGMHSGTCRFSPSSSRQNATGALHPFPSLTKTTATNRKRKYGAVRQCRKSAKTKRRQDIHRL